MDSKRCAEFGQAAVDVGTPDRGQSGGGEDRGDRTDATDTVTNILHFLDSVGEEDPTSILSSAVTNYYVEKEGAP